MWRECGGWAGGCCSSVSSFLTLHLIQESRQSQTNAPVYQQNGESATSLPAFQQAFDGSPHSASYQEFGHCMGRLWKHVVTRGPSLGTAAPSEELSSATSIRPSWMVPWASQEPSLCQGSSWELQGLPVRHPRLAVHLLPSGVREEQAEANHQGLFTKGPGEPPASWREVMGINDWEQCSLPTPFLEKIP